MKTISYSIDELQRSDAVDSALNSLRNIIRSDLSLVNDFFFTALTEWILEKEKLGLIITKDDYDIESNTLLYAKFIPNKMSDYDKNHIKTILMNGKLYSLYMKSIHDIDCYQNSISEIDNGFLIQEIERTRVEDANKYIIKKCLMYMNDACSQFSVLRTQLDNYLNSPDFIFQYIMDHNIRFNEFGEII